MATRSRWNTLNPLTCCLLILGTLVACCALGVWRVIGPPGQRGTTLAELARVMDIRFPYSSVLSDARYTWGPMGPISHLSGIVRMSEEDLRDWMDTEPLKGRWRPFPERWASAEEAVAWLEMDPFFADHRDFLDGTDLVVARIGVPDGATDLALQHGTIIVDKDAHRVYISLAQ